MAVYIAFLRGINVSGQKLIRMDALRSMFESIGCGRVQTYIQSGNVVFDAVDAPGNLRLRIEEAIRETFGYDVTVVIRTTEELEQVLANSPFDIAALAENESWYAALLADEPASEGVDRLLACSSATDAFEIRGCTVYILCRQGFGKSQFSNNFLEKKLGVAATTRNWRTMNKLAELGRTAVDSAL